MNKVHFIYSQLFCFFLSIDKKNKYLNKMIFRYQIFVKNNNKIEDSRNLV